MDDQCERLLSRARSLVYKFGQTSETHHIDEAIALDREALALCAGNHPQRSECCIRLSHDLWSRYNHLGVMEDLNEATDFAREAVTLCPLGHPDQLVSLSNLAADLWTKYNQLGSVEDLDEAIRLDRDVLDRCSQSHPELYMFDNNLAIHLYSRYTWLGGMEDLEEAITLGRKSLALCSPSRSNRSLPLGNLPAYLYSRYKQLKTLDDLNEAISLGREALALRPPGNSSRSSSLSNLALHLAHRYKELGNVRDLEEAIVLGRDALSLRPPGHPGRHSSLENLAVHLYFRFEQRGEIGDIDEAIGLDRDSLAVRPFGHPDRSSSLKNLVSHLSTRYKWLGEVEDQEELFSSCAELANVSQNASSSDLSAAKAWIDMAEEYNHSTTLLAYQQTLRLLVNHLATLPLLPQNLSVLKALASSLAVDAFSASLRHQHPAAAVELLEQGRSIFWRQLVRLRSPLDDVTASGPAGKTLADEFMRLSALIRNAFNSPRTDQHDRVCHLSMELQTVVLNIRELPGLSHFLLPSPYSDLRRAASDGPIIVVNASQHSCDALIVFADRDPIHIPLSVAKKDVQRLSTNLHALTMLSTTSRVTKEMGTFLRELWKRVVSPIADRLRSTYPLRKRVWWCPTAEFSLLPLHAAGAYSKGKENFSDLYISSYTPSLSALIRARQPGPLASASEEKRFIAIGQANASGTSRLYSVSAELTNIERRINGLATFTRVEGEESCISRVTEELGKNQWVHLACHGIPNRAKPFGSAFALHDGRLTLQRIIECNLQNPEFVYLSACHTTVGDEESPDEAIHLAAAMQFIGFRSVVATMWAVDDAEASKVTSAFYKHIANESQGNLDYTRAAFALWRTVRTVDVPLDQRVLYVHLGV